MDGGNNRIRKVDQQGIITTVAGTGEAGFSGDGGPATAAALSALGSLAFDAAGNLYIVDGGNNRIRKIDTQGIITTVAGTGRAGAAGDNGPATAAELSTIGGLAIDADGSLYIGTATSAFAEDARVRKIDGQGIITTVAGTGVPGFSGDGLPAIAAQINSAVSLGFDLHGNLYIVDITRVRRVDSNGIVTTVAGGGF